MSMLDAFLGSVKMPEVLAVELAFSMELVDPETGEELPVPLIGAIDAVVVDEKPTIWELKTGKRRWSQDQLAYDLQPTAYIMAARELEIDAGLKIVLTTKASKPQVQIEDVRRSVADERDLAATAAGVVLATGAGVDHPIRGWQCKGCPYQGVCE